MTTEVAIERNRFAEADEFTENPEPRVPLVLCVDVSGSMGEGSGEERPIDELNAGLRTLKTALTEDQLASKRVEVAIVTFPETGDTDFTAVRDFEPATLRAGGPTPLGGAIKRAAAKIRARKDAYRSAGILYSRPWLFLLTDADTQGMDPIEDAARLIREGDNEEARAFCFFAVGTERADFDLLRKISVRAPVKLRSAAWQEMFLWVADSMKAVSRSKPGDDVPLDDPSAAGWATTASPKVA